VLWPNVKAWYFESHKPFYKLSLEIHSKKIPNLVKLYGELKFEIWVLKLLLPLKKKHYTKKAESKVHRKIWSSKSSQKVFSSINLTTPYYHWIFYWIKKFYEGAWSPYSLIVDYYRFLGTSLKVYYVMTIQKLLNFFIQCDYSIYFIIMLSLLLANNHFYLITWPIVNLKSCKNYLMTTFYGQCNVLSPKSKISWNIILVWEVGNNRHSN
jgi:hypothetical protein